jgi:DNA-binding beta-propeller fold protein YncE
MFKETKEKQLAIPRLRPSWRSPVRRARSQPSDPPNLAAELISEPVRGRRFASSVKTRRMLSGLTGVLLVVAASGINPAWAALFPNSITVIDTATNAIVGSIGCAYCSAVAFSPDGTFVFAAGDDGWVSVFDTATYRRLAAAYLGVSSTQLHITITPDGTRAYVIGYLVWVFDTKSHTVMDRLRGPCCTLSITPDGARGYIGRSVLDLDPNSVTFHTVVATLPVDVFSLTPDGTRAYELSEGGLIVIDIDPDSERLYQIIATIPYDTSNPMPLSLAVSPDGARLYVASSCKGICGSVAKNAGWQNPTQVSFPRDFIPPSVRGSH